MTETTPKHLVDARVEELCKALDTELLIPMVMLEKSWNIGSTFYAFYVRRPFPLFLLDPLQETFENAFRSLGIDPSAEIAWRGKNRTLSRGSRIERGENYINQGLIKGRKKLKIPLEYLQVRWVENGITFMYWHRFARISVMSQHNLEEDPELFMFNILKNLNYPKYVVRDAVVKDKVDTLVKVIKEIEYRNAVGWKIVL